MEFDLKVILPTIGYAGIFAVIFAESGLLVGFFLPGDSLLFTAGFLASQNIFDIRILATICFIAAVSGDSVGYTFGSRVGKRLFHREDSIFFHKKHLDSARRFYEKHGKKTIVLARFLPVVRTFAPIVAGIGDMEYKTFVVFNVVGGFLWSVGLTMGGYWLGKSIPNVDHYLLPIILGIVILSILPQTIHILKNEEHRQTIKKFIRRTISRK